MKCLNNDCWFEVCFDLGNVEPIKHTFHSIVICLLYKPIEGYMVCRLYSSLLWTMWFLNKMKQLLFVFYSLAANEDLGNKNEVSPHRFVSFYFIILSATLSTRLWLKQNWKRERLSLSDFGERWVNVICLCHVNWANKEWGIFK